MSDKNTHFPEKHTVLHQGKLIDLSRPVVMGILNLTPDSFFQPNGRNGQPEIDQVLQEAGHMLTDGAGILDLGAYSSRPGADHISEAEEMQRLLPAVRAIKQAFPEAILSVDTFRAKVAEAAIAEGASLINDISGGEMDASMFATVARLKVPYILMHMQGTPQTMQQQPQYEELMTDILAYFIRKIQTLKELGVYDIILDPGFGFGKTLEHNYEILAKLDTFQLLGCPILAGVSRKSMIYKILDTTAADALNGTTVANTIALMKGAQILRVHDVKPALEAVKIVQQLKHS